MSQFLYLFLFHWASGLFPCLHYCGLCCFKYRDPGCFLVQISNQWSSQIYGLIHLLLFPPVCGWNSGWPQGVCGLHCLSTVSASPGPRIPGVPVPLACHSYYLGSLPLGFSSTNPPPSILFHSIPPSCLCQ